MYDDFLDLKSLVHIHEAGWAVIFVTAFIQWQTRLQPARVGALVSLCVAMIGVLFSPPQPWYLAVGNVFLECANSVCMPLEAPKPTVTEAEPKREFWRPWF